VRLTKLLCAIGLVIGSAAIAVPLATEAGAVGGITFYVNSPVDTSATDCSSLTNVDCGIGDAVTAFDSDSTVNDADSIVFADEFSTFSTVELVVNNPTPGVTLAIQGNGPGATILNGNGAYDFLIASSTVTVSGLSIIDSNFVSGGAIINEGDVTLMNVTLSDDMSVLDGGALFNLNTATLTDDTFTDDSSDDGGAVYNAGVATFTDDTFSHDTGGGGGAVYNNGVATFTNDTFFDNGAASGGGVYNENDATFTDDTFFDNGSGLSGAFFSNGTATLANSIFEDDSCFTPGGLVDNGYSVEYGSTCGTAPTTVSTNTPISAATLAANGSSGPETVAIDPTSSAYEVVPAGNCVVATDERGDPRPGVSGAACDAGAFEYQEPASTTARSPQTVTIGPLSNVTLGVAPFTVSPTASSGLAVVLTSKDPTVCSVSGSMVTVLAVGTCTLVAAQGGSDLFIPAAAEQAFQVDAVTAPVLHAPGQALIRRAIALATGGVVLVVSAPSNGGSRLTSYQYSVSGRAWVSTALSGRVIITGLAKSHVVTLRVRARNAVGAGAASNAVRVSVR